MASGKQWRSELGQYLDHLKEQHARLEEILIDPARDPDSFSDSYDWGQLDELEIQIQELSRIMASEPRRGAWK